MDNLSTNLEEIEKQLIDCSTPEGQEAVYKFVPHSKKVFGVRMPVINALAKEYKSLGIPLARALWKKGGYEEKLLAAKLLDNVPTAQALEALECIDHFRHDIDNWAICDTLGMQSAKKALKKFPEKVKESANRYLEDPSPWTVRLGLVYLVYFARHGRYLEEISEVVGRFESHPDYYVRKAVVWVQSNLARHE